MRERFTCAVKSRGEAIALYAWGKGRGGGYMLDEEKLCRARGI